MIVIFNIVLMFVACYLVYVFAIEKRPKREPIEQSEQPEQNSPEFERPNVYYSKFIQIVSEPAYLTPPYRYSEVQRITVECLQDNTVLLCGLLNGNLLSVQIKDDYLYRWIENFESTPNQKTTPVDVVTDYLFGIKIFKH